MPTHIQRTKTKTTPPRHAEAKRGSHTIQEEKQTAKNDEGGQMKRPSTLRVDGVKSQTSSCKRLSPLVHDWSHPTKRGKRKTKHIGHQTNVGHHYLAHYLTYYLHNQLVLPAFHVSNSCKSSTILLVVADSPSIALVWFVCALLSTARSIYFCHFTLCVGGTSLSPHFVAA